MPAQRRVCAGRRLLAILATAIAVAATAAPARAAQVGTVSDLTWGIPRADVDRTVAAMRAAGIRWVRLNASWAAVEPNRKGALDAKALADLDYAVHAASGAGMRVLMPIADGVPYWASADPRKSDAGGQRSWNRHWRPTSFADYGDVVRAIVRRYSAQGVHDFEIWNEPNHPRFWPSGPSPAQYVELLRAGSQAVRAEDPEGRVVLGGLAGNDYAWLERLYTAGARGLFDVAAVHPYTGSVDPTWCWDQAGTTRLANDAFCAIEEVHRTMAAAGDAAVPIWLTEFGWSTNHGDYGVTEPEQAQYLEAALRKLESYPYVHVAFWYSFRNVSWLRDAPADWEANLGLLRTDFAAKPALAALKRYTGAAAPVPPAPAPVPTAAPASAPTAPAQAAPAPEPVVTTKLRRRARVSRRRACKRERRGRHVARRVCAAHRRKPSRSARSSGPPATRVTTSTAT
jgi:hypothetical protein